MAQEKKRAYRNMWMVEERASADGGAGKTYWTKVGVAFENRDGSWSVELAAVPVNGRLQMRDPVDRTLQEAA